MNWNPDGLGEVLIYPYYTVNGGNTTLISVMNTTSETKAVKVRFLEGSVGQDVLDFNLYLAEFDVWTGAVMPADDDPDGVAYLFTSDTTCTVPNIVEDFPDGVPLDDLNIGEEETDSVGRTREGHIEMIEMAVLTNRFENSDIAATHVGPADDREPSDCAQLEDAWRTPENSASYWVTDPTVDTANPEGGLAGAALLMNVQKGTAVGYLADALDAFRAESIHTAPGSSHPTLADADPISEVLSDSVVDSSRPTRVVVTNWTHGIDAVTAVLQRKVLLNEYNIDPLLSAETEWVVTFPTKRFYVDAEGGVLPFRTVFEDTPSCMPTHVEVFNRESAQLCTRARGCGGIAAEPPFQPDPPPMLCWTTNVMSWTQSSSREDFGDPVFEPTPVLASSSAIGLTGRRVGYPFGWAQLSFTQSTDLVDNPNAQGHVYTGLPVTGFAIQEFVNGALESEATEAVLANYATLFRHRGQREICTDRCS